MPDIILGRKGGGGGAAAGVTSIAETGQPALTGAVTLSEGTGVTLTQVGQDISIAAAGGSDPVQELLGTPDTAFEFQSASLVGLTALTPTPDVENADTTVPDCYYLMDNAAGVSVCGRYVAAPAPPYTAVTLVKDFNLNAVENAAGLFYGDAVPGAFDMLGLQSSGRNIKGNSYTNPTTDGGVFLNTYSDISAPVWFAFVVNTDNDVDFLFSMNGWVWRLLMDAVNPTPTPDVVGIAMKSQAAGGCAAAFDYLRIWNSAKTFPGV